MTRLSAAIEGIGFWAQGLPDWNAARACVRGGAPVAGAPARPSPQLLAPNERRRAPDSVAVALEVALAACHDAGREAGTLPSVFASTHGDLAITDYMCATLADSPRSISPTRFHNSVHNAAAGYWTIGAGCTRATTAISAFDATFAEGLVEALLQLHAGHDAVLLAAYDGQSTGPVAAVSRSEGLLGAAFVLARTGHPAAPRLDAEIVAAPAEPHAGTLGELLGGNAMAPMLPLLEALALGGDRDLALHAGPGRALRVRITMPAQAARPVAAVAGAVDG